MTDRATEKLMDTLHGLQAKALIDALKNPGEEGLAPAMLAQVNKFLKDNGIDRPGRTDASIDELANLLPDLSDLEVDHPSH